MGEGPVAFQYSAEVFPTIQREQGMVGPKVTLACPRDLPVEAR